MNYRTSTIVSTCLLIAAAIPAWGQADEDARQKEIQEQIDRAVQELFQDLELPEAQAEDEPVDPRERIIRDREREEAFKRRLLQLQLDQRRGGLVQLERAAEPLELDAQPHVDPWADHSREQIVAALDHTDYAKRESAQASLLTDDTLTKDDLESLIRSAKSPEQRKRLLSVAEHHVLRVMRERDFGPDPNQADPGDVQAQRQARERAAVGYSYEPVLAHENPYADLPGVQVIATMPGFPGHAHLRRGDIIVQINGLGLARHHREGDITNWVRWQISSRAAGQTIDFTVLRGGEMLSMQMVCAEGSALDHMYTTDARQAAARKQPYRNDWEQVRGELIAAMPHPETLTPKLVEAPQ